jgi:YidC/Oxa1 family membrane protein insertase
MNESRIKNDTAGMLLALKAQGEIKKRAGISLRDQFAPMIAQSVVGFCGFRLLNAMAKLPVPSLHDGGLLWLHDLTVTDGYLIAPILMGATMHVIFRLGGESGAASKMKGGMRKFMLYGMPCIVTLITSFQPGAVVLWFIGSSSIGIPQALLLQRPKVREFFKIAPMYKPKPGEEFANPFEAMLQGVGTKPASASAAKGPVYQAPNINSRPGSKTIDAQLVNKTQSANSDMVQPRGPQKPARGRKQRGGN